MAQRSKTIDVTAQFAGRVARAVGLIGAALSLPVLPVTAVAQSAADGMITIPGNGENVGGPGGAALSSITSPHGVMNAAPYASRSVAQAAAMAPAQAAHAEAQFQAAARGAQIVIPGNGEAGAHAAPMTIETVHGPTLATRAVISPNGMNTFNPAIVASGRSLGKAAADHATAVNAAATAQNAAATPANGAADSPELNPAVAALLANGSGPQSNSAANTPARSQANLQANSAVYSAGNSAANSAANAAVNPVAATGGIRRVAFNPSAGAGADAPPAAGADLARLQQQAATELTRDSTSGTANAGARAAASTNTRAAAGAAANPAGNTSGAGANAAGRSAQAAAGAEGAASGNAPGMTGKPAMQFSPRANVPTAHSMPTLDTITPGQNLGSAMSPAARFAASAASRAAAQKATEAPDASGVATVEAAGASGAQAMPRAGGVAQPPVTVASSDGPPIEHSVTVVAGPAVAAAAPAGKQDPAVIMKAAEDFLKQQAAGLPGHVTITVPPIMPRGLAACDNLQTFMAPGAPLWGRTTVGVRCTGEKPWTIYVLARVSVQATYYVAARQILPGDVIQTTDLLPRDGDLAVMPRAIVTDPSQAVGAVAQSRITPGLPLRSDLIRSVNAIQLGQTVKVVAEGDGFSISTDGSALNNASPGQQVRVKTDNGQTVVGTAAGRGIVQIPM